MGTSLFSTCKGMDQRNAITMEVTAIVGVSKKTFFQTMDLIILLVMYQPLVGLVMVSVIGLDTTLLNAIMTEMTVILVFSQMMDLIIVLVTLPMYVISAMVIVMGLITTMPNVTEMDEIALSLTSSLISSRSSRRPLWWPLVWVR